jgi:large subunit ribosomal protein L34e
MPRPALRSTSFSRVSKKTPGGRTVTHYRKKKPSPPKCAVCKKPLKGVPRVIPSKLKRIPKSEKRPNRPYGGNLCSSCMRKEIKEKLYKSLSVNK